jgi:hypothetical protein
MSGVDPFAGSRRSLKVRTIVITSVIVVAAVLGIFFFVRSRQSTLIIQSPVEGMTVALNGAPTSGTTTTDGLRIPIIAGQYRLTITRPNYLPFQEDVRIPVGTTLRVRPVFTLMPIASEQTNQGGIQFARAIPDRNLVFYLGDSGTRIYRYDAKNQTQLAASERSVAPITDIQWPQAADVALITRRDGVYLLEMPKYDFRTQRFDKVGGSEYLSPVWDPNRDRVAAALFLPNGERSLILADKRFTNLERRADLTGFTNPLLVWSPDSRFIAVVNRSQDTTQNNVWLYSLENGDFVPLTNSGEIVAVRFNPSERTLLIERTGQRLSLRDLASIDERAVTAAGTVAQTAWRDATSFYLPEAGTQNLLLISTNASRRQVPYTLPSADTIQSLSYFNDGGTLILTTTKAVYTVAFGE